MTKYLKICVIYVLMVCSCSFCEAKQLLSVHRGPRAASTEQPEESNRAKHHASRRDVVQESLAVVNTTVKSSQGIADAAFANTSSLFRVQRTLSEFNSVNAFVGIYELAKNGEYVRVCSGTIINYFHIITAGHCVWDGQAGQAKDTGSLRVVAGLPIYPRHIADTGELGFNVSHIFVAGTFAGLADNCRGDVAIVRLHSAVKLTDGVSFVALDWDRELADEHSGNGQKGFWLTSHRSPVPGGIVYQNATACIGLLNHTDLFTNANPCRENTDLSGVDSGAAFLVYHEPTGTHYAVGILSVIAGDINDSKKNQFMSSINDVEYLRWIKKAATGLYDPPADYKPFPTLPAFYRLYKQEKTWQEAKDFCETDGNYTYLGWPTKESEYAVMYGMLSTTKAESTRRAWVGMNDRVDAGEFHSLFSVKAEEHETIQWADNVTRTSDGEAGKQCVEIAKFSEARFGLNVISCEERLPFICGFSFECALLDSAFGETQGVQRYLAQ